MNCCISVIMRLNSLLKHLKKSIFKITFKRAELGEQKHSSEGTAKTANHKYRNRKITYLPVALADNH